MLFGQPISLVWRSEQWKRKKLLPPNNSASTWGRGVMRHSFHHPALTTCGAPLPPGKKYVAVRYLTGELIFFVVDVKGKGQEIFEDACKYLGLQDTELFGLAFSHGDEYIFIDPNLKVSKYALKSWKMMDFGISGDGQPLLILNLRVKHYVDCHLLISEKVARHQYYLQLRENVKRFLQPVSEEKFFVLAALALQADLGNFSLQRHKGRYFDISSYFPSWFVSKIGEDFIIRNIPALHKDNSGLSRGEAQVGYIKEASDKTSPHNMHLYKMQRRKGKSWSTVSLGICDAGLHIYEQQGTEKTKSLLSTFMWCNIAKLHFEKKKFEILSEGNRDYRRFTYSVGSEEIAKNVLWLCRSMHHFHMSNEARVQELKKLELDGGKVYRESYIYTDETDLAKHLKENPPPTKTSLYHSNAANGNVHNAANTRRNKQPCNIHRLHSDAGSRLGPVQFNRSFDTLPLSNGCLSPDAKYKSQSIACFPERLVTPYSVFRQGESGQLWNPSSNTNLSVTPTSTLLSQNSCTNSACSSLSLASGSTAKATTLDMRSSKKCQNDLNQWVKCDSFEELAVDQGARNLTQKICISTFKDRHVRTASFYDAVGLTSADSRSSRVPKPVPKRHDFPATSRTATRIGVSSLNREQRLPLTLFKGCGSEPNLFNSLYDCNGGKLTDFAMLRDSVQSRVQHYGRKPNSRSEMCLSVLGQCPVEDLVFEKKLASTDVGMPEDTVDGMNEDFPFIPPPLAYRNSAEDLNSTTEKLPSECNDLNNSELSRVEELESTHRELQSSTSSPPDILDIQQLRQKSQDLDLPLISALCNDRSLLMLPKTVPTCSRQRHLGNKDPLRFARGYSTTPSSSHISDFAGHSLARPATWHVESSSWSLGSPWLVAGQSGQNLPPTILTSFGGGRTVEKCNVGSMSGDYRLDKLQLIPTKLMSGMVSNGKVHLKGSSS